jgi:hypothetical protein
MREWWSKLVRALQLRRGLDDDLSDEMRRRAKSGNFRDSITNHRSSMAKLADRA